MCLCVGQDRMSQSGSKNTRMHIFFGFDEWIETSEKRMEKYDDSMIRMRKDLIDGKL